jgi:hypothetical protein
MKRMTPEEQKGCRNPQAGWYISHALAERLLINGVDIRKSAALQEMGSGIEGGLKMHSIQLSLFFVFILLSMSLFLLLKINPFAAEKNTL